MELESVVGKKKGGGTRERMNTRWLSKYQTLCTLPFELRNGPSSGLPLWVSSGSRRSNALPEVPKRQSQRSVPGLADWEAHALPTTMYWSVPHHAVHTTLYWTARSPGIQVFRPLRPSLVFSSVWGAIQGRGSSPKLGIGEP